MKYGKMQIFLIVMLTTILMFLGFSIVPAYASAETVSETSTLEEVDEGEASVNISGKDEIGDIIEPIICAIASLLGTGLMQLLTGGTLGRLTNSFKDCSAWFQAKKEELANEEIELQGIKKDLVEAVSINEEMKEFLAKSYERNKEEFDLLNVVIKNVVDTSVGTVKEMQDCYEQKASEIERQYKQIKDILIKLAIGNAALIRNGITDEIVKILEQDKEKGAS